MQIDPREQARLHLQAGQPDRARVLLGGVLAADPNDGAAHVLLAGVELMRADAAAAEAHARAAITGPATRTIALATLAEVLSTDPRRLREAVDAASAAAAEPDDWRYRGLMGELLARTGDLRGGWAQAEAGVRLAPDDPAMRARALVSLAKVPLHDRHGGHRMLGIMQQAVALDPTDPDAVSLLAFAQLHARRRGDRHLARPAAVVSDPPAAVVRRDAVAAPRRDADDGVPAAVGRRRRPDLGSVRRGGPRARRARGRRVRHAGHGADDRPDAPPVRPLGRPGVPLARRPPAERPPGDDRVPGDVDGRLPGVPRRGVPRAPAPVDLPPRAGGVSIQPPRPNG